MRLLLLSVIILAFSCTKSNDIQPAQNDDPKIVSCTWVSVTEAGGQHPKFTVSLIADSNKVSSVRLYWGASNFRWEVKSPVTGSYIMYDHISEFPTAVESRYYYFIFFKKDGSTVPTTPFWVY